MAGEVPVDGSAANARIARYSRFLLARYDAGGSSGCAGALGGAQVAST